MKLTMDELALASMHKSETAINAIRHCLELNRQKRQSYQQLMDCREIIVSTYKFLQQTKIKLQRYSYA